MNLTASIKSLWTRTAKWFSRKVLRLPDESNRQDYRGKLINENSAFSVLESYRAIRTNIQYTGLLTFFAVIGVTSAMPNEGKSLSCSNLAISFAMSGKKVLIVDCDLRNPSQHRAFGVADGNGLSEYLSGQIEEVECKPTFRENLDLLLTGKRPPNPTELLSSDRMKTLLTLLKGKYDVIFLDLPPVGMMTDAAAVADRTDGYVLVVESGESEMPYLDRAIELLSNVNAKILGLVLNNVSQKNGHYGYGRYGRYGAYETNAAASESIPAAESAPEAENAADDASEPASPAAAPKKFAPHKALAKKSGKKKNGKR